MTITPEQTATLRQAYDNAEQIDQKLNEALQPYYKRAPRLFHDDVPEALNFDQKLNTAFIILALFEEPKAQYHDMSEKDQKLLHKHLPQMLHQHPQPTQQRD